LSNTRRIAIDDNAVMWKFDRQEDIELCWPGTGR